MNFGREIPVDPWRFRERSFSEDQPAPDEGSTHHVAAPYHPPIAHTTSTPSNEFEALLMARPFVDPEMSLAESNTLREVVSAAVDSLGDRERFVVEGLFYEQLSIRELATRMALSKSHVHRIKDQAVAKLREALES